MRRITRQKRHRGVLAPGALGWGVAAALAAALLISLKLGSDTTHRLTAELAVARAQNATAGRNLAVCEAKAGSLESALAVRTGATDAATRGVELLPEALLARQAAGADACARAFEAEALVREAAR